MWELVFACIVLFLVRWIMQRRQHFSYFKSLGIPGPQPSIFLGNMMELYKKTPTVAYREWINRYGKVVGYFNGYRPILLVADLEVLKMVQIKDFQDFLDRALLFQTKRPSSPHNKSLMQLMGARWKEVRSVLTPSYTSTKLKMMSGSVISTVEELVGRVGQMAEKDEDFEIGPMYQALTLDVICRSALGINYNLQQNPKHPFLLSSCMLFGSTFSFIAVLLASFPGLDGPLRVLNGWRLRRMNNGVHPFLDVQEKCKSIVTQRQKVSVELPLQKDLLQLMIEAKQSRVDVGSVTSDQLTAADENEHELKSHIQGSNRLTYSSKTVLDDDDITQNAFMVLVAGFETTSNSMTLITHMLVNYPEVQEKVRREVLSVLEEDEEITYGTIQKLPYLHCVVCETMRIYPPVFGFVTREAAVDKQYGELKIPAGTAVMSAVDYIHHDPDNWEDPYTFDPDRFLPENKHKFNPLAWQPFGAGPRNCIGMRFAQMEIRFTFAHILRKYRLVATENTEKDPPKIDMNPLVLRIKNGVNVKAVPL
ncbi:thromboxane-A synthase [Ixodes scapularis]|nr:thromboxane-A synthase [Ixodes scapularis]